MKTIKTACPLDCFDVCSIKVTLDNNKIIDVKGDDGDSITKGFICKKGMQLLEKINHPKRLTSPMKKVKGKWIPISWEKAIEEIGDKLMDIKKNYGSTTLIHYAEDGHGGLLKNIDTAFFNAYGGVAVPKGSLCWGAGIKAQTADFGNVLGHDPHDHLNAKTIIIWGRNPAFTNAHLVPFLKEAQKKGTKIVVIDPIKTATASFSDYYYQVRPETDGYLAMAMGKIILEEKSYDEAFVMNHCNGFDDYKNYLNELQLETLIEPTGLMREDVYELTSLYADNKPSSIILGYGLQRYRNGGKNIRLIDALGAITGNIGISGGGVNYANKYIAGYIDSDYVSNVHSDVTSTSFKRPLFSKYVLENREKIKGILVTKSNLVVQIPDTKKAIAAFSSIPFKVVIDHFMTDTAALADYVLPCTGIYEEEDFIFSSMWHSHCTYTEKILEPIEGVKHEFEIFNRLAQYMKMEDFLENYNNPKIYLERALKPLIEKLGCTFEELKGKRFKLEGSDIPWQDKKFATASGKFELIDPAIEIIYVDKKESAYPLHFLTLHPKISLHSQHYMDVAEGRFPEIFCNDKTMKRWNLVEEQKVMLISPSGELKVKVKLDDGVGDDIIISYEGWWLKNQGVNNLTPEGISDLGDQAIYNNCRCRIEGI
ncbi:Anaerobic selenocysteine-containing dehydrogenase [Anaerovirgula multivorans]|uniref:Anaerobic selenocysteine-containing dehydrogenase n=1 Tax=Anaerovirgula multivorans TaxID=312168 RepID=A0A239JWY7_9FIRM|nr:molybdopterin-dependent oxidoreductase [Anaerovirgula multivorans]SNT10189.1 Anaerobic selenocysteine-containing dehydrogenase [Anaerovirgula multivorans]